MASLDPGGHATICSWRVAQWKRNRGRIRADILNRLTFKDYPTGSDVTYQYDNVKGDALTKNSWGRLRVMYMGSEASNGHLYEYDNRGRTVKEEVKIDSVTYTTLYAYDAADRVKAMTYPGGEAVTTVYNSQGLPETLTGSQAYVTEAGYNALGQKKRYTLGNGAVTTWTYYGESQAAVLRHPCPVDRL